MVIYACVCTCEYFYDPQMNRVCNKCTVYIIKIFHNFTDIIFRLKKFSIVSNASL